MSLNTRLDFLERNKLQLICFKFIILNEFIVIWILESQSNLLKNFDKIKTDKHFLIKQLISQGSKSLKIADLNNFTKLLRIYEYWI